METLGSGAATGPAVEGSNRNYINNNSRSRGRVRDSGPGYRNSGGNNNRTWVPTADNRSNSSAPATPRSSNTQCESKGKSGDGAADESSSSTVTNSGPPAAEKGAIGSNGGGSSSRNKNRASGKVSNDRRPSDDHGAIGKNFNERGKSARAIQSSRGEKNIHGGAVETCGSFVPYLPQDDAVLAGLGEREGWVDASETQEVANLLNEQLSALLCLPPRQYWKKVATDKSLGVFLDSYLQFRRRWFDTSLGRPNGSVVSGDGDLSRRVFMVLLRMSSNQDPGTPASESLSSKEHAVILLERRLLDLPKLMDIAVIYHHDNPDLTRGLVSNVFKVEPSYVGELAAYIRPLLEKIYMMHQRCSKTVEAVTNCSKKRAIGIALRRLHEQFLEVVIFLTDVIVTLTAFVNAYPPAAKVLVSSANPASGQGLFLPALATVHDTLLPILQKGFTALGSSLEDQQFESIKSHRQQRGADPDGQDQLRKLNPRLVELVWKLLEFDYLSDPSAEDSITGIMPSKSYGDPVWKGDSLLQAIVSLGPFDNHDESFDGEHSATAMQNSTTGALLQSLEKSHGLSFHISQARQRGSVVLDDAQQDYLSALLADNKASNGGQDNPLAMTAESFPQLTLRQGEGDEETVIQQSKITQVKDIFPDYGDGFISACLEVYDNDSEKVIERILDGTLHSDLLSLDTSLMTKPAESPQPVKDKGKGKVCEETILSKGKSIWEDRGYSKEFGSSSSVGGNTCASYGQSYRTQPEETVITNSLNHGRYVRRRQDDENFSDLLDSRKGNKDLHAAIVKAAAQIEYDDEYDDSYNDLGDYIAEGMEETETLVDQIAQRGRLQEEIGRSDRPVGLTPWANTSPSMERGNALGAQKITSRPQKSAPVGPEVEGQYQHALDKGKGDSVGAQRTSSEDQRLAPVAPDVEAKDQETSANFTSGQGQGGGRGGRGRKKWKEQGAKPEFYLKDGKLYSYKVVGAVGVSIVKEAEAIKQDEAEIIYGLGAGGNVPMSQQDTSSNGQIADGAEENSKSAQGGASGEYGRQPVESEQGHGASRGRGAPGRGSHGRRDANHHRKDQATKKHFGGLGGY